MGLSSFRRRVKERVERLHNPNLCPECGSDDTEEAHYYMRCNADGCDVLTYQPTDFRLDIDL